MVCGCLWVYDAMYSIVVMFSIFHVRITWKYTLPVNEKNKERTTKTHTNERMENRNRVHVLFRNCFVRGGTRTRWKTWVKRECQCLHVYDVQGDGLRLNENLHLHKQNNTFVSEMFGAISGVRSGTFTDDSTERSTAFHFQLKYRAFMRKFAIASGMCAVSCCILCITVSERLV